MSSYVNKETIAGKLVKGYLALCLCAIIIGLAIWYMMYTATNERINSELANVTDSTLSMIAAASDVSIQNTLRSMAEKNREIVAFFYQQVQEGVLTEAEAKKEIQDVLLAQTVGKSGYPFTADISRLPTIILRVHPKAELRDKDLTHVDFLQEAAKHKKGYLEYEWKNPGETVARKKVMAVSYFEPWKLLVGVTCYKADFVGMVKIEDLRKQILSIRLGKKGTIYVMDMEGNVLVHPTLTGVNVIEEVDADGKNFAREMVERKNGRITYNWLIPGENKTMKRLALFRTVPKHDWIVAARVNAEEIYAPLRRVNYVMAGGILVFLILLLVPVLLIRQRVLQPLKQVTDAAQRLGNLELTIALDTDRRDEVGGLFNSMHDMTCSLKQTVSDAAAAAVKVNSSAAEILAAVGEQASVATQQSASISEISTTMEEFSATSAQIAANSDQVVQIAAHNLEKLREGVGLVDMGTQNMNRIHEDNERNINEISDLKEKTDEITKVMGIINSIADQTKLIAFNAAIEASSAGEAGKRFGVVAVEIRRLADNVMESTSEIESRINEIQAAANHMVIASEKSTKGVQEGIDSFTHIDALFDEALASGQSTSDAAKQISLSTQQQKTATSQVVTALKEFAQGSRQMSEAINNIQNTSKDLTELAETLNDRMEQFVLDDAPTKADSAPTAGSGDDGESA